MIHCIAFDLEPDCALTLVGGVVAAEPKPSSGEAHPVWRHGVFPAHHPSGHHLRLALPSWCHRSPSLIQPAGGCGAHCANCCPLHHLPLLDPGKYAEACGRGCLLQIRYTSISLSRYTLTHFDNGRGSQKSSS